MTSKIKFIVYLAPLIVIAFLLFCFIGMCFDDSIENYSAPWFFVLSALILYSLLMWSEFVKIPKISIDNGSISYRSKKIKVNFKKSDILKLERTKLGKNTKYSNRGGLEIHTKSDILFLPYLLYSNEKEILQYLYNVSEIEVDIKSNFGSENFSFLKYFYRVLSGLVIIPLVFLALVIMSKSNSYWGILISVAVFGLLLFGLLLNYRYLKIEEGYLKHINPFLLKSTNYNVSQIVYSNGQPTRSRLLTVELADKRIVILRAGLNTQIEIDELSIILNAKPISQVKLMDEILEKNHDTNSSR